MSNHSEAGKGSNRRPAQVSQEELDRNWDLIFKKKKSRIDIIGQNGNEGIHYDSDNLDTVTTNDEYDDKRKNF